MRASQLIIEQGKFDGFADAASGNALNAVFARQLTPDHRLHQMSSAAAGAAHWPVCTGEVCTIVLRGATSQWKRSRADSLPISPAAVSAGANGGNALQHASDELQIHPRIDGEQRLLVEFDGRQQNALDVARQNDAGIHELAAFDARYHPNDRVVIGEKRVHAGLP